MPTPICVKCQVQMRCELNGQLVNDMAAGAHPSTYWAGDRFACPCCAVEIIAGLARSGMSESAQRTIGRNTDESITFANGPEQREKYAGRFEKQSEPADG